MEAGGYAFRNFFGVCGEASRVFGFFFSASGCCQFGMG